MATRAATARSTQEPELIRTSELKLASNRGTPRVWIEGQYLRDAGFAPKEAVEATFEDGRVILRLDATGERTVSVKRRKGRVIPIIDVVNEDLATALGPVERVTVRVRTGEIVITPVRTARHRARRVRNGREASAFSGGGLMTEAARRAGYEPALAIETDPAYADIFCRNHPDAVMLQQPIEEVDASDVAAVGPVELLTLGIPCQPFSRSRTTRGGTRHADTHPEAHDLGDMTFWALRLIDLLAPYSVVIENVPAYLESASYVILRHALTRMGYHVDGRVLDAREFGALTGRRRAVVLAHTDPLLPWAEGREAAGRLGDILEPAGEPSLEWFDFSRLVCTATDCPGATPRDHADPATDADRCPVCGGAMQRQKEWLIAHWERQAERGNGFPSQQVDATSTSVGTIKKRYFAQQGDNPVVTHPTRPHTFRWLTMAEVKRLHRVSDDYDLGATKTRAGEIMGQGVDVGMFEAIFHRLRTGDAASRPAPDLDASRIEDTGPAAAEPRQLRLL